MDEVTSWRSNRNAQQHTGNDSARVQASLSTAPNGDNGGGSGEPLERNLSGFDHEENLTSPGLRNSSSLEEIHPSAPAALSQQTVSGSSSPFLIDVKPADGWNITFLPDREQTENVNQLQPKGMHVGSPGLPRYDAGDADFPQTQQDFGQDVSTQVGGGAPLPMEPSTDPLALLASTEALEVGRAEDDVDDFAKHLRRLRRRIDIVLLKRTQWRHEHQKTESCRRFLRESTNELMSAMHVQQPVDVSQSSPQSKKKKKNNAKKDQEIAGDRQSNDPHVASSAKVDSSVSTAGTNQEVVGGIGAETMPTTVVNINELFERYLDDFESLAKQEELEKKLMEDLSSREFHLEELHQAISKDMHSSRFAAELRTEMLQESLPSSDSSSRTSSEESLPPPVEQYFDLQGNIGIYLERLQDLDYEHQEGLQEREFVRDRGDELEISDEEFESNYKVQRAKIESDLNGARYQIAVVAERCKQAGLDPEIYRNAAQSPHSMSPVPSGRRAPTGLPKQVKEPASRPPLSPTGRGPSSLEIEGWLRDVPDNPDPDAGPLPPPEFPQLDHAESS